MMISFHSASKGVGGWACPFSFHFDQKFGQKAFGRAFFTSYIMSLLNTHAENQYEINYSGTRAQWTFNFVNANS